MIRTLLIKSKGISWIILADSDCQRNNKEECQTIQKTIKQAVAVPPGLKSNQELTSRFVTNLQAEK